MSNKRNVQHQNGNPSSYNLEADDKIHTILHKNEVFKLDFFLKYLMQYVLENIFTAF